VNIEEPKKIIGLEDMEAKGMSEPLSGTEIPPQRLRKSSTLFFTVFEDDIHIPANAKMLHP
jgi:hypothetical protein